MATLVDGTVPADQFALAETFATHPSLSVRVAKIVVSGTDAVLPLIWVRNVSQDQLRETVRTDPTVEDTELIAEYEEEDLYRMKWETIFSSSSR